MNYKRFLLIVPLLAVAFFLTTPGTYHGPTVNAQEKTGTTTGYPTGTKCPKSGTYRASNKYLEIIIVVAAGEIFPPFSDGSKTIWYPVKSTT
jgi:hypothetical protein